MATCNSLSLYVGDLRPEVDESRLHNIFNKIGEVSYIRVIRDKKTKRSRGYAYVNFKRHEDAEQAIKLLNFEPILGQPCRIMWQERDSSKRESGFANIYIKNIDKSIDTKALHMMFSQFGNILSCKVELDERGESRGFGYVNFEKQKDSERAIEKMNGMIFIDKQMFVCKFKGREDRHNEIGETISNKLNLLPSNQHNMQFIPREYPKQQYSVLGFDTSSYFTRAVPKYDSIPITAMPKEMRSDGDQAPRRGRRLEDGILEPCKRLSLKDRVQSQEASNIDEHCKGTRTYYNSRHKNFAKLKQRSQSTPRKTHPSDVSDDDGELSDSDKVLFYDETANVSDRIYEVASREYPNEANLIVKLIREKCDGEELHLLQGSSALMENEIEKAYKKIKLLESPITLRKK